MIKKIICILPTFVMCLISLACPVCERNQPRVLKGITHGAGPESQWDYLIIGVTAIIVLTTLFYSVKWLIKPGEKSKDHIKRFILNNNADER